MPDFHFRLATPADNASIARLIRTVMPAFGAGGAGFAINDPEVDFMGEAYQQERHLYLVLCNDRNEVVGGGGIAPLVGADATVCEVRKMYFMPEARSHGLGSQLMTQLLSFAKQAQYKTCYLETLSSMVSAQKLYRKFGFTRLEQPLGKTGHGGCDQWYSLML